MILWVIKLILIYAITYSLNQAIDAMKNLPNKEDMTNLPKGPADHAMEGKTAEEKQGWTYNYGFKLFTCGYKRSWRPNRQFEPFSATISKFHQTRSLLTI
jgi:hypothetical protein